MKTRGYFGNSCWGCVILHTRFQTGPVGFVWQESQTRHSGLHRQTLCHHYLDNNANEKISYHTRWIGISLFVAYSFGIETTSTFIHSVSSLENHSPDSKGAVLTDMAFIRKYTLPSGIKRFRWIFFPWSGKPTMHYNRECAVLQNLKGTIWPNSHCEGIPFVQVYNAHYV